MLNIDTIKSAKHIVICLLDSTDYTTLSFASALYSYVLTLHKKVTLYSDNLHIRENLNFLPWVDKLKSSYPSSADLEICLKNDQDIFLFFKENKIKLNKKMATSLYAALLSKTNGFLDGVDGMGFALANELVEAGADVKSCNKFILNYNSLASLRLKAILLKKMLLVDSANVALFELDDQDLKYSGAALEDAKVVVKEALSLPTVNIVIVKYKNKEIIKEGEMV